MEKCTPSILHQRRMDIAKELQPPFLISNPQPMEQCVPIGLAAWLPMRYPSTKRYNSRHRVTDTGLAVVLIVRISITL